MIEIDLKIREYNALERDELFEILRLRNEVFIVEQKCSYQDICELDIRSLHLTMTIEKKLIGYLRIHLIEGVVKISRVVVSRAHRNIGYGRLIMLFALDKIVSSYPEKDVVLSAQSFLVDFYKSFGFTIKSEPYLLDGIMHQEMIK